MASASETLEKLQSYANKVDSETAYDTSSTAGKSNYGQSLDDCLKSMKLKVGEEAASVEKVRRCRPRKSNLDAEDW